MSFGADEAYSIETQPTYNSKYNNCESVRVYHISYFFIQFCSVL